MKPLLIRYFSVFTFVTIYVAVGYLLKLNVNEYLLVGIPLTLLFQLFVVRQPLWKLWAKDSEKFKLNTISLVVAIALAAFPLINIVNMIVHQKGSFASFCYQTAAVVGAVGAGFCFSRISRKTIKDLFLCLIITSILGGGLSFLMAVGISLEKNIPLSFDFKVAGLSLLQYLPVLFVIEEVVFRGMLDAYLHPSGNKKGFLSALYISALWGLWHLPTRPIGNATTLIVACFSMILIHSIVGIPLSIFWRRSENLAVPGFSHAFIDAIRNGLMKNLSLQ